MREEARRGGARLCRLRCLSLLGTLCSPPRLPSANIAPPQGLLSPGTAASQHLLRQKHLSALPSSSKCLTSLCLHSLLLSFMSHPTLPFSCFHHCYFHNYSYYLSLWVGSFNPGPFFSTPWFLLPMFGFLLLSLEITPFLYFLSLLEPPSPFQDLLEKCLCCCKPGQKTDSQLS